MLVYLYVRRTKHNALYMCGYICVDVSKWIKEESEKCININHATEIDNINFLR